MSSPDMFKKMIRGLIKAVQRTILSISLFLVYYVVFGVTVVVAFLFNRRLLVPVNKKKDSAWLIASGYENDLEGSKRES